MIRVFILDNYDSFTWNLAHLVALAEPSSRIRVVRRDKLTMSQIRSFNPTHLILSPGPGRPEQVECAPELIEVWAPRIPILGVCLGHQCIALHFGGTVGPADRCMHGKQSLIIHDGHTIYTGLGEPLLAMRYHSLIVLDPDMGRPFAVSSRTEAGEIMGIRHRSLPVEGVQFHPESFATQEGVRLMKNFIGLSNCNISDYIPIPEDMVV